jgi:hypothetical protein
MRIKTLQIRQGLLIGALLGLAVNSLGALNCAEVFIRSATGLYNERQFLMDKGIYPASHIAYAKDLQSAEADPEFILHHEEAWLPERQAIHQQIVSEYLDHSLGLARELEQSPFVLQLGKPVLIFTQGSSGAGKTHSLTHTHHDLFASLRMTEAVIAHPMGVLNPDIIKFDLASNAEQGRVPTQVLHREGAMLVDEIIDELLERKKSLVVDRRIVNWELLNLAHAKGYYTIILDVEVPLGISAQRVLQRPVSGLDPRVPFEPLISGAIMIHKYRSFLAQNPLVNGYVLFNGDQVVAEKISGPLKIYDENQWSEATSEPPPEVLSFIEDLYSQTPGTPKEEP